METKRFIAFIVDCMFSILFFMLFAILIGVILKIDVLPSVVPLFVWAAIFCKDSFNGRSLGKSLCKYQVINTNTGKPARPLLCLLRNLFLWLGIIDLAFMFYKSEGKRLGDYIAHTKVVKYDYTKPEIPWFEAVSTIIGAILIILLINFLLKEYSSELGLFGLLYK